MNVARTPLFFGPESRSLFGWYHAPKERTRREIAVLVCPPLGHEYIHSHRSLRHLTDRLAIAGIASLRFDYDGTGDSAGAEEDPGRVAAWRDSVRHAARTLRQLSGAERIVVAGFRFGATLAALFAAEEEVDGVVLWVPVVRGRAYSRELRAIHLTGENHSVTEAGEIEPGGFLLTEETQRDIAALNVENVVPKTKRALIVVREDAPADERLRDVWANAGIAVEQLSAGGYEEMLLPPHNAVVPTKAITDIVDWIARDAGKPAPQQSLPSVRTTHIVDGVRESIVRVDDGVFGIVSEPVAGARGDLPVLLLANGGSTHHVGPNRLYVDVTRALSRVGYRCLRYDLPGLGDSFIADPAEENDPYLSTSSAVIEKVMGAMQHDRFVSMGLCSGAHASFHAALDLDGASLVESVLINPLTFYYEPGMSLDQSNSQRYDEWQQYMRSMRTRGRWVKLLRGEVRMGSVARAVLQRFRDILSTRFAPLVERLRHERMERRNDLERDLQRIIASGRELTFIFSRFDAGYDLLMMHGGPTVKRLRREGRINVWRIDHANHTFEARRSREQMVATLRQHLLARYAK
ncbi:MAG: alpha/beta fold hydrolase [Acidobacteriota bacterium]|nr:alpha/beta fold hydrolase [Acidobacteriota bacterium]